MTPENNTSNISPDYLETLNNLTEEEKKRFIYGGGKNKTMKTLLFIVLKVLEVAAFLAVCWFSMMLFDWIGIIDLFNRLLDSSPIWAVIVLFVLLIIVLILWFVSIFSDWIKLNKEWVNQILKK